MLKLLVLGLASVYLWRRWHASPSAGEVVPPRTGGAHRTIDTVRCAHCGMHVPRDEAVGGGELWFCSAAHEREFRRNGG